MSNQLTIENVVSSVEQECTKLIARHNDVDFGAEANYAMQLLYANDFALKIALGNPVSVQNALRNASAIGISLNPANKHAYLVPRKGSICLDISYMGLLHLAMSTGSIEFGQAKLVYEKDVYENVGIDKPPVHKSNTFGDRGNLVGVYCVVRTNTGAYLTEEMTIDEVNQIKNRSESAKKGNGPWITDYFEMVRKTVIKRASKYWPKVDRLNTAIDLLNTEGEEGISFNHQKKADPVDVTPVSVDVVAMILDTIEVKGRNTEKFCEYLSGKFKRQIKMISELTSTEAAWAIKALEQVK